MSRECSIVRDLLPLYVEGMISEDTRRFMEEHLEQCEGCCSELKNMAGSLSDCEEPEKVEKYEAYTHCSKAKHSEASTKEIMPLKVLRNKMLLKKIQTILFTAVMVIVLSVAVFGVWDAPRFFAYSEELLTLKENEDGSVTVTFRGDVTDYSCEFLRYESNLDIPVYNLEAWTSDWDRQFTKRGVQSVTVQPENGNEPVIYYVQNNGEDDVLIYGGNKLFEQGGRITMPRLALAYYLTIAVMIEVVLLLVWLVVKKWEKVKVWLEKAMLLPVSYMIGHVLVKGFHSRSYAMQRDFSLIVILTVLVYCGLVLAYNIWERKKGR